MEIRKTGVRLMDTDYEAAVLLRQVARFIPIKDRSFVQRVIHKAIDNVYASGYLDGIEDNEKRRGWTTISGHFETMMVVQMHPASESEPQT